MDHEIEIKCEDGLPTGTYVLVNGKPVDSVTRVDWSVVVNDVARAKLYCEVVPASLRARGLFIPSKGTPLRSRLKLAWLVLRGER